MTNRTPVEEDDKVDVISDDLPTSLAGLLNEKKAQLSAFRLRNRSFVEKTVPLADLESWLAKGWEVRRPGKRQARIKCMKSHFTALEDRAWCLLFRMGYGEISDQRFVIKFKRASGSTGAKQIDAFACDAETALIIECKSKEARGRRSLQKDILETAALQNYIRQSIYRHFGPQTRPKIVWLYVTSKIIWSENDLDRARDAGIYVITENEMQYYETFLSHMGRAGRYQILGEFLRGQKIPAMAGTKVPAIRGVLGGQIFFAFVSTPQNLLKISFINHQALNHPDGSPAYQRMISPKRIAEIREFIRRGGFFPTNILINFTETPRFDLLPNKDNDNQNIKFGLLTLPSVYRSAWIIDGQHRLYGYSDLDQKHQKDSLFVLAFDKMSTHKEADLFITINNKQKSVPKGLLVALLADLRLGDDDPKTALAALASTVIKRVNHDRSSPLAFRFSMPDVPPDSQQNLTISEAVNGLVRSGLLGRLVHGKSVGGILTAATNSDTVERSRLVLNGYFEAIRTANAVRWEAGSKSSICVNPGIRAHLMLINELIRYLSHKMDTEFFEEAPETIVMNIVKLIRPVQDFIRTASDEEIKSAFGRKFGEGGVKEYLYKLCTLVHRSSPDFGSDEFKRILEQKESDKVEDANQLIMKLSEKMTDYVVKVLKSRYGEKRMDSGEYAYWEQGVTSRRVIENAFRKQQADAQERRKRKEAYLDILDLKDIIEDDENWPHFRSIFNAPMPNEKLGKKYYTGWMAKYSEIRNIAAHKNALRTYSDEDLSFVDWLRSEILQRIEIEPARA